MLFGGVPDLHVMIGVKLIGRWGILLQSQISKFQIYLIDKYLKYFQWNCY